MVWTADSLAMTALVWRLSIEGAVRGSSLADEFEHNMRFAPPEHAEYFVILALLARAATAPDGDRANLS